MSTCRTRNTKLMVTTEILPVHTFARNKDSLKLFRFLLIECSGCKSTSDFLCFAVAVFFPHPNSLYSLQAYHICNIQPITPSSFVNKQSMSIGLTSVGIWTGRCGYEDFVTIGSIPSVGIWAHGPGSVVVLVTTRVGAELSTVTCMRRHYHWFPGGGLLCDYRDITRPTSGALHGSAPPYNEGLTIAQYSRQV